MMSVQLAGANNFQAGDYTVNVKGLTEEALTGTVKIEAAKVASIEILSDVAVLSSNPNGLIVDQTATVGYIVKDQYGTDITKTTELTTNDSNTVKILKKGTVTISGLAGKRVDDLVAVVLVHASSGTTVSKAVKLSAASTVADISVDGIYNAKGEKVELKDNTEASKVFLVVNLKDQYGKDITPVSGLTSVIVTNTNPLVAKLKSDKITKVSIDGKDKFVVEFEKLNANNEFNAGEAELLFITTMDGKTFKNTISVSATKTTDSVTVGQPQFAIIGEDVKLPITVLDKEGNIITDKDLLVHPTKGIKVDSGNPVKSKITVVDGQVYYNVGEATGAEDSYKTVTVSTSTYKVGTVTYKVTAAAKPVAVRGLKKPLVLKASSDAVIIDFAKVNVEDQYGRTMKTLPAGYSINLKADAENKYITVDTEATTVKAKAENATTKIVIYLENSAITGDDKEVKNSAVEQQVRVTDGKEYTSYEIEDLGKVQIADGFKVGEDGDKVGAKSITVNGILNGGKVALGTGEYTATLKGGKLAASGLPITDGTFTVNKEHLNTETVNSVTKTVDTEFTLNVTINATGKVLEQKFIVSEDARKVENFFFTTEATTGIYDDAKAVTSANLTSGNKVVNNITFGEDAKVINVATIDQYGNKTIATLSANTVTIVPAKVAEVSIDKNGTVDAKATLATGVTKAELIVKVKLGNATQELNVTLVPVVTP